MGETKVIYVYGETKEQAEEYIRNYVKPITGVYQLRGHDENTAVLITLPREKDIVKSAIIRKLTIIEA